MIKINTNKKEQKEKKESKSKQKLEKLIEKAKELQKIIDENDVFIHTNFKTKHVYQGENSFILECEKIDMGYTSNFWIGYNQLKEIGGYIKKGSVGCPIKICRSYLPEDQKEKPEGEKEYKNFFNVLNVFNMDCVVLDDENTNTESVA